MADLAWYADRILTSQDVRQGPLRRRPGRPVDPLDVTAVLHGMSDHTLIVRLLDQVVDGMALCPPGDPREPAGDRALSLGRWLHRVADEIERTMQEGVSHEGSDD